jgi:hypothetical protein
MRGELAELRAARARLDVVDLEGERARRRGER